MLQQTESENHIILLGCSLEREEINPFIIKTTFHVQDGIFP